MPISNARTRPPAPSERRPANVHLAVRASEGRYGFLNRYVDIPWKVNPKTYGVEIKKTHGSAWRRNGQLHLGTAHQGTSPAILRSCGRRQFFVDRHAGTLAWKQSFKRRWESAAGANSRSVLVVLWALPGAIELIGLENLMLFMYDDPQGLHQLRLSPRRSPGFARWLRPSGFCRSTENDYVGSGSTATTHDLPSGDYQPGGPVRTKDLWCCWNRRETVGVGPEQFGEFVLPYENLHRRRVSAACITAAASRCTPAGTCSRPCPN